VWGHVTGKPADRLQLAANVTLDRKLDEERELFSRLSIQQMEEIAAESQALVDKVMAKVNANARETRMVVGVSPSPAAGVDNVGTGDLPRSGPFPRSLTNRTRRLRRALLTS
jgi:hypothetical protein